MRTVVDLAVILLIGVNAVWAADPYAGIDPYWILLHEPAVQKDLKLSPAQRQNYQQLLDELDLRFFPLRNKSRDEAVSGLEKIIAEAREKLQTLLQPAQNKRLEQLVLWKIGVVALLRDDVAAQVRVTETQRKRIREIMDETQESLNALDKEANEGKPRGPLEKKFTELKSDESKKLLSLLKPEQKTAWRELLGPTFDLTKLGPPAFKAPELVNTDEWINSEPVTLKELRGKVVVVHFYAAGCINCIRNFPWYREWHDRFKDKEVAVIGIHTPETASERDVANVRKKAADEKFAFPVLIDGNNANWNAWGNSMWPSVYVIDKRGYLRYFWPGELKWQGNDGEKFMRERIEQLLSDPAI